jgi:hypothetical protein
VKVIVTDPSGSVGTRVTVRFRVTPKAGGAAAGRMIDTIGTTDLSGVATANVLPLSTTDTALISVAVPGQESRGITLRVLGTPAPSIASVQPASFKAGDTVTVRGLRLGTDTTKTAVFFAGVRSTAIVASGDSLVKAIAPSCLNAGAVGVRVLTGTIRSDSSTGTYATTAPVLALQPLQGVTVDASKTGCAILPAADARYLVIPQFAAEPDTTSVVSAVPFALGAVSTTVTVRTLPTVAGATAPGVGAQFDLALRRAESAIVDRLGPPKPKATPREMFVVAPPTLGSTRTFNVLKNLDGSAFDQIPAKLSFVGNNVLVYTDATPIAGGGFSDADIQGLGPIYDQTLYPLDVATFGSETDIDDNGRVIVLLTKGVNALTPKSTCSTGYIAGFFYGLDLYDGAKNSNSGEVFYAAVPDPAGNVGCALSVAGTKQTGPSTFIHEFQHMISFGQHVLVRNGRPEIVWLNEGLSHIAEETAGRYYENKFPSPSGRTNPSQFFPDSAQGYTPPLLQNAYRWMLAPRASSPLWFSSTGTLEERGSIWLFLRWLADHKGEGIFARLDQTSLTGSANLTAVAGESMASLYADFAIATILDSVPGQSRAAIPARWKFNDGRVLRRIFNRFANPLSGTAPAPFSSPFPVTFDTLKPTLGAMSASLLPGGLTYAIATTTAIGGASTIRFGALPLTFDAFAPKYGAQVSIVRLP